MNKITLQSTSRMSLNDRFTGLRGADAIDGSAGLQQRRQVVQASRKNQRLAQQMEHRPAVIAALNRGAGRGRGRGVVAGGGLLRGARGARGMIRVGSMVAPVEEELGEVIRPFRSTTRGAFSRGVRGVAGVRGVGRGGAIRGINFKTGTPLRVASGTVRGRGRGVAAVAMSGALRGGAPTGRGSVRGINFKTGAPLRQPSRGTARNISNGNVGGAAVAAPVPVKKRLAVQGRLSQPLGNSTGGWNRGGFTGSAAATGGSVNSRLSGVRGRGGRGRGRGRGAAAYIAPTGGYQTRTFRGRGSRGGRGGYSQQWQNGY